MPRSVALNSAQRVMQATMPTYTVVNMFRNTYTYLSFSECGCGTVFACPDKRERERERERERFVRSIFHSRLFSDINGSDADM